MAQSSLGSGQLNAFQRLMLHWGEVYPYNATHAYKIAGPLRQEPLLAAIRDTYEFSGLGCVELTADGRGFQHSFDPQPSVQVVDGGRSPDERLAAHFTAELNRPFERPRCRPLRFSVIDAGPKAHYLSVAYDHWIADSVTARLIVGHVIGRYCGLNIPDNETPLAFYPGTYRDAFASRLRGTGLATATVRSLRNWAQQRLSGWPTDISNLSMDVRYEIHRLQPGTVDRLRAFAHSCGAKVHDVILAALARAMAESSSAYFPRSPRRGFGLGTIVDTRPGADVDLSRSLGMFLAYYLIHCRPDRKVSLTDLVRQISAMTGRAKSGSRYVDSLVSMKLCNAIWRFLPKWYKPRFAQDIQPLDAGVSNVVVRDTWIDRHAAGHVLEYMRGASTGPMLPLVLSPTTLGDQMNLGVTYRVAAFSPETIQGIVGRFVEQIENPAGSRQTTHREPALALSRAA